MRPKPPPPSPKRMKTGPTPEQLARDKRGLLHTHDWHTTFSLETRCTVCSVLHPDHDQKHR